MDAVVRESCRAKLNLYLDVVGRRADGYHDIETVFHEISLADDLEARALPGARGQVTIDVVSAGADVSAVPGDATNLAARAAAALLAESGSADGVALRLWKRVPAGGGLGGGSADAAGALRAVNRLLALGASDDDLERVALTLGSDVPFLVRGGTAIGRGRGERLERVPAAGRTGFVLLFPGFPVPTAAVYRALPPTLPPRRDPRPVLDALAAGDADALGRACSNALLPAALAVEPRLAAAIGAARAAYGPRVHLSGSGSTLFVPCAEPRVLPVPGLPAVATRGGVSSPRA
jgi:4-diphosphocytidyl-2-C-methyl-D-erythritol kinase